MVSVSGGHGQGLKGSYKDTTLKLNGESLQKDFCSWLGDGKPTANQQAARPNEAGKASRAQRGRAGEALCAETTRRLAKPHERNLALPGDFA